MLFKTIRINKTKAAAFICAVAAAAAAAFIFAHRSKTADVFNDTSGSAQSTEYEEILGEALPHGDGGDIKSDIKSLIANVLGFDAEKPESVIAEFSPVFDVSPSPAETAPPEETPAPSEDPAASAAPVMTAEFPSKAEINAGAGLQLNNATSYSVDLNQLCAEELDFSAEQNSSPQVLIVHTHTTECYDGDAMNGETERSTDETKNVIAVGNVIAETLEQNGIRCVHDKTVHDYPTYQSAYTRTLSTIDYNLKQYPDIKIVLDVHRDAYIYPDGSKLKVTCDTDGVSTAQVMLVLGTDSLGLSHPSWRKNLSLAAKLQSAANIMYPGMMRPINLRRERFNMHMTTGSMLLEIGSNGNTLDEAKAGGRNIANALSAVLTAK